MMRADGSQPLDPHSGPHLRTRERHALADAASDPPYNASGGISFRVIRDVSVKRDKCFLVMFGREVNLTGTGMQAEWPKSKRHYF